MIRKGLLQWTLCIMISILIIYLIHYADEVELSKAAKTEKVELLETTSVEYSDSYWYDELGESEPAFEYTFLYTDPDTGEVCTSEKIRGPYLYLNVGDTAEVVTYNGRPNKLKNDGCKSAKEKLPDLSVSIIPFLSLFVPTVVLFIIFRKVLLEDLKRRPLFSILNDLWLILMFLSGSLYTGTSTLESTHGYGGGTAFAQIALIFFGCVSSFIAWIVNSVYWNIKLKKTEPKPIAA